MITYKILNTAQEQENIIVFVWFSKWEEYTEESLRFPIDTPFSWILETIQERCDFLLQRDIEIQEQFNTIREQLLEEEEKRMEEQAIEENL